MSPQPFPFAALPRLGAGEVAVHNAAVAWLAASRSSSIEADEEAEEAKEANEAKRLRVLGLELSGWRVVGVGRRELDSSAGLVWLGREGLRALVSLPGEVVRSLARRLFAAPAELAAPRPLTAAEQGVTAMLAAAVLHQLGAAATVEPWQPFPELRSALVATEQRLAGWLGLAVEVAIDGRAHTLQIWAPPQLVHRRPAGGRLDAPSRRGPARGWTSRGWGQHLLELPVVVAAAPMRRRQLARLTVRDVVIVAAPPSGVELRVARGAIGLRAEPGAAHAVIESGYGRRVPPLSDAGSSPPGDPDVAPRAGQRSAELADDLANDLAVELTVALGTTALSLRQLAELTVGQVVSLGRPLAGPFELRVGGQVIGSGELVDVEGSLGVRVASLRP